LFHFSGLETTNVPLNRIKRSSSSSSESRIVSAFHDARRTVSNFFARLFRSQSSEVSKSGLQEDFDLYGAASRKGSKKSIDDSSQFTLKQHPNYKIDMSRFRRDQQHQVPSKGKFDQEEQVPVKSKQVFEPYSPFKNFEEPQRSFQSSQRSYQSTQRSYQEPQTPQKSVQTPQKSVQTPLKGRSPQTHSSSYEHFESELSSRRSHHSSSSSSFDDSSRSYRLLDRLGRLKREAPNKVEIEKINQELMEIKRDYIKAIQILNEKATQNNEPEKTVFKKLSKNLQEAAKRLQTIEYFAASIRPNSGQDPKEALGFLYQILKLERKRLEQVLSENQPNDEVYKKLIETIEA